MSFVHFPDFHSCKMLHVDRRTDAVRQRENNTTYQLQTTQEDQRASCRAAPHLPPLWSRWIWWECGEQNQTKAQTLETSRQVFCSITRCVRKRVACTSPHEENTYGLSLWGNYGEGGGYAIWGVINATARWRGGKPGRTESASGC